jgi:uncharacterized membrane protein HdeD (DUF308 family)
MEREELHNQHNDVFSWKSFYHATPYMISIIGIALLIVGIFSVDAENANLKELVTRLGEVLIVGGLFSIITSIAKILGVFRTELEAVIYQGKYLDKQKHIDTIYGSALQSQC